MTYSTKRQEILDSDYSNMRCDDCYDSWLQEDLTEYYMVIWGWKE